MTNVNDASLHETLSKSTWLNWNTVERNVKNTMIIQEKTASLHVKLPIQLAFASRAFPSGELKTNRDWKRFGPLTLT